PVDFEVVLETKQHEEPFRSFFVLLRFLRKRFAYFKCFFSSTSRLLTCCTVRLRTLPSLSTSSTCGRNRMTYCVASALSSPPAWNRWIPGAWMCCKKAFASSAVL